jgi:hypothetical protein
MNQNIYILLEILDGRTLRAWHFAAKTVQRCAKKIIELYQKDNTYFENAYWVSGISTWAKTEAVNIESLLTYLKNAETFAEAHKCSNYRLFNQSGEGHEMFEVAIEVNIPNSSTKPEDYKISRLESKSDYFQFLTNYEEILEGESYRVSTDSFDFKWVEKMPRLNVLERKHFGGTIVDRKNKAVTVAVYFNQDDDPIFVSRRSTLKKNFYWLVSVNEFNLWEYERITWAYRDNEHRLREVARIIKQQAEQTAKDNAAQDLKLQALKESYKQDVEARLTKAKTKLILDKTRIEVEISNWKSFKDECNHYANIWLYGQTQQGMNNINNLLHDIDCFDTPWFMDEINW